MNLENKKGVKTEKRLPRCPKVTYVVILKKVLGLLVLNIAQSTDDPFVVL